MNFKKRGGGGSGRGCAAARGDGGPGAQGRDGRAEQSRAEQPVGELAQAEHCRDRQTAGCRRVLT